MFKKLMGSGEASTAAGFDVLAKERQWGDGRWSMPWPEYVAMRFHQAYEELAPLHGYETRRASAVPWVDVPEQNRDLMVDVVRRLLAEGVIRG